MSRKIVVAMCVLAVAAAPALAGKCSATGKCGSAKGAECTPKEAAAATAEHAYGTVDTAGLKQLLDSGEPVVLLDARSGKYDDGRRIANAKQLSPKASAEEIAAAVPDKNAKIVAYCSSLKCPASAALADRLVELGFNNVVKYPEGIDGWEGAEPPAKN